MATSAVLLVGALGWYVAQPPAATPPDRLDRALKLLDAGRTAAARELAKGLEEEQYHDSHFGGGVEYVLGMAEFRAATDRSAPDARPHLAAAVTYLREAERRGIPEERQPDWAYAYGKSLYDVGSYAASLPWLETVASSDGPNQALAAELLVELSLYPGWSNPQRTEHALKLSELVCRSAQPGTPENETALLQRASILLQLGRLSDAEEVVAQVAAQNRDHPGVIVLRAQILMASDRDPDAVALLESVATDDPFDRMYPRQACYLMGLAAERYARRLSAALADSPQRTTDAADRSDYRQRAVEYYRKTVNWYEHSDEAVAALVALGQLEQESGAHEKALQSYGGALRTVRGTDDFRSRWISLDTFRERILHGWMQWLDTAYFPEAIALAELMTPLFPRDQAYELSARAHQKWADQLEADLNRATATERAQQLDALRQLWRDTGAAYDRLAQARRAADNYKEAIWQAAEFYRRGQDFDTALLNVNQFLAETSAAMRPVALARRGQILLDLDRVPEAEADFHEVIRLYPTSAAAFTAQYLLGICRLEQDDPHGAVAQWEDILSSDRLAPVAAEWRDALLALAKLHEESAAWSRRQLERAELSAEEAARLWQEVSARSTEAARLLDEYVARYPQSTDLAEARFHLGKALQLQGDCRLRQWQLAETENSREQSRQDLNRVLERALVQFRSLRDDLNASSQADQLSAVHKKIWQNAWFELPHTLLTLERYDEAIAAYAAAVHRFPHDARVLTAYVQMAQAYTRLGREVEARSMLEQAKVILDQNQIPVAAFTAPSTSLTQQEWEQWLDRVRQVIR